MHWSHSLYLLYQYWFETDCTVIAWTIPSRLLKILIPFPLYAYVTTVDSPTWVVHQNGYDCFSLPPPMSDFLTHELINIKEQLCFISGIFSGMSRLAVVWSVGALSTGQLFSPSITRIELWLMCHTWTAKMICLRVAVFLSIHVLYAFTPYYSVHCLYVNLCYMHSAKKKKKVLYLV